MKIEKSGIDVTHIIKVGFLKWKLGFKTSNKTCRFTIATELLNFMGNLTGAVERNMNRNSSYLYSNHEKGFCR